MTRETNTAKLDRLLEDTAELKVHAKHTNGRVTALERWQIKREAQLEYDDKRQSAPKGDKWYDNTRLMVAMVTLITAGITAITVVLSQ